MSMDPRWMAAKVALGVAAGGVVAAAAKGIADEGLPDVSLIDEDSRKRAAAERRFLTRWYEKYDR